MRKRLLIIGIILGLCLGVKAQAVETFMIHFGEVPVEVIPLQEQIRYPEFREGLVYYTNEKTQALQLNYSMLYAEMQYISPEGDTLAISNEQKVKKVVIGKEVFYSLFGKGFVEVVTADRLSLARRQVLKLINGEGLPTVEYSSDNSYVAVPTFQQLYHRPSQGIINITKQVHYLFIDHNHRFYPARKSVLLQLYPRHGKQIKHYLKTHQIDFKQQAGLEQVVAFCSKQDKK